MGEPKHPAKFSKGIVPAIDNALRALGLQPGSLFGDPVVVDPFAGTGRIHQLRDLGYETHGFDIEPEYGECHEYNYQANSRELLRAVAWHVGTAAAVAAIATSPVYGNRMSDTLLVEGREDYTYSGHHAGLGRKLDPDNAGGMQWTDPRYLDLHRAVWAECAELTDVLVLNIKDHERDGFAQGVPAWHCNVLGGLGFELDVIMEVKTRGQKKGTNKDHSSGDGEWVFGFRKRKL